jgi:hypothetical protein
MKFLSIVFLISLFLFAACEDKELLTEAERDSHISMSVVGLNDPGATWYEAWILWNSLMGQGTDIDTLSLGLLERQSDGSYRVERDLELGYIQAGIMLLVTIELDDTVGNAPPSQYVIFGAKIIANGGLISVGNEKVLNFDFSSAKGSYILDTPTQSPPSENPYSGLWFVIPETTITDILDDQNNVVGQDTTIDYLPGLELADLSLFTVRDLPVAGWTYEAFIEISGQTLSMGKFLKPGGEDDSKAYSGNGPAYSVPGEDFLNNAPAGLNFPLDLRGARVYVTLTPPYPAEGTLPYQATIYDVQIPNDVTAKQVYELSNSSETLPGGDLRIDVSIYK